MAGSFPRKSPELFKQAHHNFLGGESHLTPLLLQSQAPTTSACSLCSQVPPLCTLQVVSSFPRLCICAIRNRGCCHLVRVEHHVFGPLHDSWVGIPSLPRGEEVVIETLPMTCHCCNSSLSSPQPCPWVQNNWDGRNQAEDTFTLSSLYVAISTHFLGMQFYSV